MLSPGSAAVLWSEASAATGSVPHMRPAAALAATQASSVPRLWPAPASSCLRPTQSRALCPDAMFLH